MLRILPRRGSLIVRVQNLPWYVTGRDLRNHMTDQMKLNVHDVRIIYDLNNGLSQCFGYAQLKLDDAQRLLQGRSFFMENREIRVVPSERDPNKKAANLVY